MKKIPFLIIIFLLTSCNQNKIAELEKKVVELEQSVKEKELIIENLENENSQQKQIIDDRKRIKQYSDYQIIDIVKKDREYYCSNGIMKNFRVRKVNENIYDVRFDLKLPHNSDFGSSVYRIKFLPNDEYTLDLYSGRVCL